MQQGIKPFPPFGAILHQIQATKLILNYAVRVFCGKAAWQDAKETIQNGQAALCLPLNVNPDDFSWPVKGLSIIVFDSGGVTKELLIQLADNLITSRAKIVWIYSNLYPEGLYFTSV